jgi:long-chain acyl-CoA synthetase
MPFAVGCHITFLTKIPTPQIILKAFGEIKPRLVLAVPLIIEKIYKKQLLPKISTPAMKILMNIPLLNKIIYSKINRKLSNVFGGEFLEIVIGGAALNPEVEDFLRKIKFRYTVGYGMTECGPLISYSGWRTNPKGSCGKTINYLEVKIDSINPENEPGEILIRGENVMEGYYKNPEATSKTLVDGWLRSGDLGVMDKHGFIHIMGRSKSMILGSSGQNIYPEEIEARLNNLPYIQESLIVEQKGKLVGLIYPDYESMQQQGLSDNDIAPVLEQHRVELNKHLPQYSQVVKLTIYNQEFEKTPKKSIKRFLYQFSDN